MFLPSPGAMPNVAVILHGTFISIVTMGLVDIVCRMKINGAVHVFELWP